MKLVMKIISLLVIACIVGGVVVGVHVFNHRGQIAEEAVTSATGNESAGSLAGKIMSGEKLTDKEVQETIGVDDETYTAVKEAAEDIGVSITDSEQLRSIAEANMDKADEVRGILEDVRSGKISETEAVSQLGEMLDLKKGA